MKNKKFSIGLSKVIIFLVGILLLVGAQSQASHSLKGGWYHWPPYQSLVKDKEGVEKLTGLDVGFQLEVSNLVNGTIHLEKVSWKEHLDNIRDGTRDVGVGATKTAEREKYAYFSVPYRQEENSFFVSEEFPCPAQFANVEAFLAYVKESNLRLGIVKGFYYAHPDLNKFIADPENTSQIFADDNEEKNLENLRNGKIDGFIADSTSAKLLLWQIRKKPDVREVRLKVSTPIHFMFSKKTTTPETVEEFNAAIRQIKESEKYGKIVSEHLFVPLLTKIISQPWFLMIDFIGTVAFAISGLIVAYKERSTLFGALIFASLPSVGGGIMRDVLVHRPLGVFLTPTYIFTILITVGIGYTVVQVVNRLYDQRNNSGKMSKILSHGIQICDAMGLAAFTVTGVMIAVISKLDPLWIWGPIMAVITGAGGGILRDMLRSDHYISALKDELYAEIALFWGGAFSLLLVYLSTHVGHPNVFFGSLIVVMAGVFITRLLAVHYKVHSLTLQLQCTLKKR